MGMLQASRVNYQARLKDATDNPQGWFGFTWSFFTWIPAVLIPAPVNVVFGIVDAVLAGHLAYATHLLAGYSPKHSKHCLSTLAHEFQLPPGAQESFFEAAARLRDTETDATAMAAIVMCRSFVREWQYGVSVSSVTHSLTSCFAELVTGSFTLSPQP
jgi:hypothetical protein